MSTDPNKEIKLGAESLKPEELTLAGEIAKPFIPPVLPPIGVISGGGIIAPIFFQVDANEQVGIGLENPRTQLHVLGRISTGLDFNSAGAITFFPPDGFAWFHIDNGPAGGRPTGRLRISNGVHPGDHELISFDQNGNVDVPGNFTVHGQKNFVHDHPTDATRQVVYVSLEGGEAGTYIRGTGVLVHGKAVIELPVQSVLVAR